MANKLTNVDGWMAAVPHKIVERLEKKAKKAKSSTSGKKERSRGGCFFSNPSTKSHLVHSCGDDVLQKTLQSETASLLLLRFLLSHGYTAFLLSK